MQRTERSLGCTGQKGQTNDNRLSAEMIELEDLAQAYGARLPDSVDRPLARHNRVTDLMHGAHPFS